MIKRVLLLLALTVPAYADLSFTFDDGSQTQIANAFPVLQQFHFTATEYLTTVPLGHDDYYMNWGDVKTLSDAKWDIEAHTATHPDLTKLSKRAVDRELDKCIYDLRWHGYKGEHFAYPYGETNDMVRGEVEKRFKSARLGWSFDGVEINKVTTIDPYHVSVVILTQTSDFNHVKELVDQAVSKEYWLVFLIHQVKSDNDATLNGDKWSLKLSQLQDVAQYVSVKQVPVVTVDQHFKGETK